MPHVCIGENVLADDGNRQDVEVLLNDKVVTDQVKRKGPGRSKHSMSEHLHPLLDVLGVNLDSNEFVVIRFQQSQTIDSIVVLADSNVNSYSVSYTKPDGDEYILEEVRNRLPRPTYRSIFFSIESRAIRDQIQRNTNIDDQDITTNKKEQH